MCTWINANIRYMNHLVVHNVQYTCIETTSFHSSHINDTDANASIVYSHIKTTNTQGIEVTQMINEILKTTYDL